MHTMANTSLSTANTNGIEIILSNTRIKIKYKSVIQSIRISKVKIKKMAQVFFVPHNLV